LTVPYKSKPNVTPPYAKIQRLREASSAASADMAINGSGSGNEEQFSFTPGQRALIYGVTFLLTDNGATGINFGGISALTTGLLVEIRDADGVVTDLLDGATIKTNGDFDRLCAGQAAAVIAAGLDTLPFHWDTSFSFGAPLLIEADQAFAVTVQDNLSAMDGFETIVHWVPT